MKERPISFNDEMLRAILEGRKTQTRIIIPDRLFEMYGDYDRTFGDKECDLTFERFAARFSPLGQVGDRLFVRGAPHVKFEITGVRVRRLQQITLADLEKEGVSNLLEDMRIMGVSAGHEPGSFDFATFFDSIYGSGYWESNPWDWVIEFKLVTS